MPDSACRHLVLEVVRVIPLPVILVEFLLAFGGAMFVANVTAVVRLRRDGNWPPYRPAGLDDQSVDGLSRVAQREHRVPSRPRILTGLVIGLAVSLWAGASLLNLT
ncbi:MAG: hypothetical protein QOG49_1287 [Frankiaceae bacterium]|nr:hypothetical protein [Frankiaceae bacterium]